MSIIKELTEYKGQVATTINGVVYSEGTYEIFDEYLIIRTKSGGTIHISKETGKQMMKLMLDAWM